MKLWVALGWIATSGFAGSAYVVWRLEPVGEATLPLLLDASTVIVIWVILYLIREFLDDKP